MVLAWLDVRAVTAATSVRPDRSPLADLAWRGIDVPRHDRRRASRLGEGVVPARPERPDPAPRDYAETVLERFAPDPDARTAGRRLAVPGSLAAAEARSGGAR